MPCTNPYARTNCSDSTIQHPPLAQLEFNPEPEEFCQFKLPSQDDDDSSVDEVDATVQTLSHTANLEQPNEEGVGAAVFCLPTQEDSSSDEEEVERTGSAVLGDPSCSRAQFGSALETIAETDQISSAPANPYASESKLGGFTTNYQVASDSGKESDENSACYSPRPPDPMATSTVEPNKRRKRVIADTQDSELNEPASSFVGSTQHIASTDSVIVKKKHRNALVIDDTPLSNKQREQDTTKSRLGGSGLTDTPPQHTPATTGNLATGSDLTNTPSVAEILDVDSVKCGVCGSCTIRMKDPLILCDGCNVAVHVSCLPSSVNDFVSDEKKEWFCEVCRFLHKNSGTNIQTPTCSSCGGSTGLLTQRTQVNGKWEHIRCPQPQRKRTTTASLSNDRQPLVDVLQNKNSAVTNAQQDDWQKRRKRVREHFIDHEALADSSDEDEPEDEVAAVEAAEAAESSFINDSSQMGYSQEDDSLDKAEHNLRNSGSEHRALDAHHAKLREFDTPKFNRRQNRYSLAGNSPDSCSGLGNLHFVRSVLEHYKQGGDPDDIERFYNELKEDDEEV